MKDKKVRKPRKNSKGLLKKNTGYKTISDMGRTSRGEIRKMRREAREKFARRGDMGDPEKPFKETKTKIKMDAKEVKKLNKGALVSATKYFKHKVNKDN